MRKIAFFLFLLFVPAIVSGVPAPEELKAGQSEIAFTERSPLSQMTELSQRLGFQIKALAQRAGLEKDYKLADESFVIYVPDTYKPEEKWGLFVWVSAGRSGRPPDVFIPLLSKHKLIWIGPNHVENERAPLCRVALAVDAAQNMMQKYALDKNRIYVSGASGGGRISSITGVSFPDVFNGGLYVIGCDFYRDIVVPQAHVDELKAQGQKVPDSGPTFWRGNYAMPTGKLGILAKKKSRHVILTGETDGNRWQCKANYEAFKKDGFAHVSYFEVPGVGHALPDAEWVDKALDALEDTAPSSVAEKESPKPAKSADIGRTPQGEEALKAAKELAAKDPIAGHAALQAVANRFSDSAVAIEAMKADEALLSNEVVKKKVTDAEDADKFLRNAKIYIDNRRFADARSRLEKILADYPNAPAAKEAKVLLKQIAASE